MRTDLILMYSELVCPRNNILEKLTIWRTIFKKVRNRFWVTLLNKYDPTFIGKPNYWFKFLKLTVEPLGGGRTVKLGSKSEHETNIHCSDCYVSFLKSLTSKMYSFGERLSPCLYDNVIEFNIYRFGLSYSNTAQLKWGEAANNIVICSNTVAHCASLFLWTPPKTNSRSTCEQ